MPIRKPFRDRRDSAKPTKGKSYPPRREGVKDNSERKFVAPKDDARGDSRPVPPSEASKAKYPPRTSDQNKRLQPKDDLGKREYAPKRETRDNARPVSGKTPAARSTQRLGAYKQTGPSTSPRYKGSAPYKPTPQAKPLAPATTPPTHWGEVAEWYDKHVGDDGSEYHREVILPGVLRLLDLDKLTTGKPRILDIACGQGVLCRSLAKEGCQVTGIDAAAELIAAAKRRNVSDHLSIDYRVGDATKIIDGIGKTPDSLKAGSFDAVTIILSIQNITPLSPLWHAVWALLKPKGTLVVVMMHPCFRIPQLSDWLWDERVKGQHRVIRQYLRSAEITIETHPGDAAHGLGSTSTTHFHRPLQAYINTMGNAGLLIDRLDEWTSHKTDQPGPRKVAMDKARQEIPLFLAMRARKI